MRIQGDTMNASSCLRGVQHDEPLDKQIELGRRHCCSNLFGVDELTWILVLNELYTLHVLKVIVLRHAGLFLIGLLYVTHIADAVSRSKHRSQKKSVIQRLHI